MGVWEDEVGGEDEAGVVRWRKGVMACMSGVWALFKEGEIGWWRGLLRGYIVGDWVSRTY